jgi:hypothetical protein
MYYRYNRQSRRIEMAAPNPTSGHIRVGRDVTCYIMRPEVGLLFSIAPYEPRTGEVVYVKVPNIPNRWVGSDNTEIEVLPNGNWSMVPSGQPPTKQRIHVRVWQGQYGSREISVKVNGEEQGMPSCKAICSLLSQAHRNKLKRSSNSSLYNYREALENGLPPQALHDALKAFYVAKMSQPALAESDTELSEDDRLLLRAQPATMLVGGKVYRLVPTGETNVSSLIKGVRRKAITLAETEANGIKERAQVDSRAIISEAESRAQATREEIDRLRASQANMPPEWAYRNGCPMKFRDGRWHIGIYVGCFLESIRYRVQNWHSTLWWNAIHPPNHGLDYYENRAMLMWVRLTATGTYSLNDVISDKWSTIHTRSYTCMELQGLPRMINSWDNLLRLRNAITRGMLVANLNSPLNVNLEEMYPPFREQLPEPVVRLLQPGNRISIDPGAGVTPAQYLERVPWLRWDRIVADEVEAAETFHLPEARPGA